MDDIVLLAFVVQFEVRGVERERCLRVVTEVEVHFRTYLTLNARLDLLVKIEDVIVAGTGRQRGVVDILMLETEQQLGATLHLQLYTARAEHLICRADVELHIGDVELLLVIMLHLADLLLPVLMHQLPLGIMIVLLLRQHVRRGDVRVTYLRADDIRPALRLVLHRRGDVLRVRQVHRTAGLRQLTEVLYAQLLHLCRCPNRTVRLRHHIRRIFGSNLVCILYSVRRSRSVFFCFSGLLRLLRLLRGFLLRHEFLQRLGLILRKNTYRRHRQQEYQQ